MEIERFDACLLCSSPNLDDIDPEHRFCRCKTCGYIFDNPRPTTAEIVRFYSRPSKYLHWVDDEEARNRMWSRRVKKLCQAGAFGSVLDVGAGIGQFLKIAQILFSEGSGTEISHEAVRVARDKYGINLVEAEFEGLEFNRTFDVVTLFHVLEHVPDPRRTITRCFSALRPGGMLVVAVPNDVQSLKQLVKRALGSLGVKKFQKMGRLALPRLSLDELTDEVHLSHFTSQVLSRLVKGVGFANVNSGLDPYFAQHGLREFLELGYYQLCEAVHKVSGRNIYDTIWLQARRPDKS